MGIFGSVREPQPYAIAAKKHLTSLAANRTAFLVPLKIDRYGRIVASVYVRRFWFFKRDLSLEMIKAGLATIYEGKDIVYESEERLRTLVTYETIAK
jgi:endonuclease YncB( thermonuclease family)